MAELSDDMDREAFNNSTYRTLIQLFPLEIHTELAKIKGNVKAQTEALYAHVMTKRSELQSPTTSILLGVHVTSMPGLPQIPCTGMFIHTMLMLSTLCPTHIYAFNAGCHSFQVRSAASKQKLVIKIYRSKVIYQRLESH